VEDQLYEGGFFPTQGDEHRFSTFHAATPYEKFGIAQAMKDERARHLAARILFNDWPQALPPDEYSRLDRARVARHHHPNAPWMTILKALAEIDRLRRSGVPDLGDILKEYEEYLLSLEGSDAA
jgi:hypothetical protein